MQVDQLKWLWTAIVVMILGLHGLIWEGLGVALRDQGFGSEGADVVLFVAITTLPLVVGAAALTFYLTGLVRSGGASGYGPWAISAGIVWGSAWLGSTIYGGVLNPMMTTPTGSGPFPVMIFRFLIGGIAAYMFSYGLPMLASGAVVGWAIAYSIDVVAREHAVNA